MAEITEEYRNRINQLKTGIENEPYIKKMRENIAEGISKTGNRQADIEVRQDNLESDFVAVQQDARSNTPSGAELAVAAGEYNTLGERLDAEEQKVNAQLTLTTTGVIDINTFVKSVRYGKIKIPDWFNPRGLLFYRGVDGKVKSNFNPAKYKGLSFDGTYYVDTINGVYGAEGTQNAPFKIIAEAFSKLDALSGNFKIVVKGPHFRGEIFDSSTKSYAEIKNKKIVIESADGSELVFSNATSNERDGGIRLGVNSKLEWSKVGNHYEAVRSWTMGMSDLNNKDMHGIAQPLELKSSVSEVDSSKNSFFVDGSNIYVRTIDDRKPDDKLLVLLRDHGFALKLTNSQIYFEKASFYSGVNPINEIDGAAYIEGDINSKLIMVDCRASGGNINNFSNSPNTFTNGFSVKNMGETYMINSQSCYTRRDGFNYHYTGISASDLRNCFVYEEACTAHDNGFGDNNSNNNATTAHEGVQILRVNGIGFDTRGPICADVQGCLSVLIDCHMNDSKLGNGTVNDAAYSFKNEGNPAGLKGKAHLINCDGISHYSITGEDGFEVTVDRFINHDRIDSSLALSAVAP